MKNRNTLALTLTATSLLLAGRPAAASNIGHLLRHCLPEAGACLIDNNCRNAVSCARQCESEIGDPKRRCELVCLVESESDAFVDLVACMDTLDTEPPHTPAPTGALAPVGLEQLQGEWYVVRGMNPAYDCWPCTTLGFTNVDGYSADYFYHFDVNEKRVEIHGSAVAVMDAENEAIYGQVEVSYDVFGPRVVNELHILSHIPDPEFVLVYYRGSTQVDGFWGATVLSRTPYTVIPEDVLNQFQQVLNASGLPQQLTIDEFCTPSWTNCGD